MTQTSVRHCTNCGAPLAPEQRFCSNCGSVQDNNINKATEMAPGSGGQFPLPQTQGSAIPPPPPSLPSYATLPTPQQSYSQYPQDYTPPQQSYQDAAAPTYQSVPSAQPVPAFARPAQGSSGGFLRQLSCGVLVVILLILLACGGIGYGLYAYLGHVAKNAGTSTGYTSTNSTNTGNTAATQAPTQAAATTLNIDAVHGTVTYASVTMTITDVKQASSFADDTSSSTSGVLRIDFKEQTPNGSTGNFAYSTVARLVLPDGTSVQPSNEKEPTAPSSGTARSNWLDFPVPSTVKPAQTTLLLGVDAEEQIKVPLTGSADLSQYQDKNTTPNKMVSYANLKWMLTNATTSLSNNGTQAQKGMRYVVVTLSVDNPSSNEYTNYYGTYLRLKSGTSTSAPTSDSTLPTSFAAGSSGKTGTVIFQVPPGASYTLIFLADQTNNVSQTTIDFQV